MTQLVNSSKRFLVLGGSGKTGRRVVKQLRQKGEEVCGVSRTTMSRTTLKILGSGRITMQLCMSA